MRLLNVDTFELRDFLPKQIPKYAILSHRWESEEVTFEAFKKKGKDVETKSGYKKIRGFAEYVKQNLPHVKWVWIDTCCINKDSAAELSMAINSMYRWYNDAEVCAAYLADIEGIDDFSQNESEWFRRGWTLQELLAPETVVFLTKGWDILGHKGQTGRCKSGIELTSGPPLTTRLVGITGIPARVLDDFKRSEDFTIKEKLRWAAGRVTTLEEDMSYSLLGIFNVSMPATYGEGDAKARNRLLAEIHKTSDGHRKQYLSSLLLDQHSEEFQKMVSWISPPDPRSNHATARRQYEPHTGSWLLQSEQYLKWRNTRSTHMWLSGKAGCGKTLLCSAIIEDVKSYCERTAGAVCAMFYFSFSDTEKQSLESLLRSLVAQLAWTEPGLSRLRQNFDSPGRRPLSTYELEEILLLSMKPYDKVFLLLDAIDECPEGSKVDVRLDVLKFLERLDKSSAAGKIFATSRDIIDVEASMKRIKADRFAFATRAVDDDIRKYVSIELSRHARLVRFNPTLKTLIVDTLAQKADGMFRWAYCQLEDLKKIKLKNASQVERILGSLPSSLDETYERMLRSIDQRYSDEAICLLNWLAYAMRPPTLDELSEAMVINPKDGSVRFDNRGSVEDTLDILGGLVAIVESGEKGFVEDKFKDFGDESEDDCTDSDEETADNLTKDDLTDGDDENCSEESEKTQIPRDEEKVTDGDQVVEGGKHSQHGNVPHNDALESPGLRTLNDLLFPPRDRRLSRGRTQVRLAHYSVKEYLESKRLTDSEVEHFHLDAGQGHCYLKTCCIRYLTYAGATLERCGYGATTHHGGRIKLGPPPQAQEKGSRKFPKAGRGRGRPSDPGADSPRCPKLRLLRYAAHKWPFHSNLQHPVDVDLEVAFLCSASNRRNWSRWLSVRNWDGPDELSPLYLSSMFGLPPVMEELIRLGYDVNARGGYLGYPLNVASFRGDETSVKVLLDNGADIEARCHDGTNALENASEQGHALVVKTLLKRGAVVDGEEGRSALYQASSHGQFLVVKILLDHGASANARGERYGIPLHIAALYGHENIVRLLLEHGAAVNQQTRSGTSLHAALRKHCNGNIVRLLIKYGADVNASGGELAPALQIAIERGHEGAASLLIEHGADVNARGGRCDTPLNAAVEGGHEKLVSLLLARGADVNARAGFAGTALQSAIVQRRENLQIVILLLEHGADVNARSGLYGTALRAAEKYGREELVNLLLEHGANAKERQLQVGLGKVAKLLAEAGANIFTRWRRNGS